MGVRVVAERDAEGCAHASSEENASWTGSSEDWPSAQGGEARFAAIEGEPGIGKTRLLRELVPPRHG